MPRYRLSVPNRRDFNANDYARTVLEAGGPDPDDFVVTGTGYHAEVMRAAYGADDREFEKATCSEFHKMQADNPHLFIRKYTPPHGRFRRHTRAG